MYRYMQTCCLNVSLYCYHVLYCSMLQGRECCRVKLQHSGEIMEVDEEDIEKVGHVMSCDAM